MYMSKMEQPTESPQTILGSQIGLQTTLDQIKKEVSCFNPISRIRGFVLNQLPSIQKKSLQIFADQ